MPRPFRKGFTSVDAATRKFPEEIANSRGLMNCQSVYEYLCRGGADEEEVKRLASPIAAAQPLPPPPEAVQPIPNAPPIARAVPSTPFWTVFPGLKDLAVTACSSRGQVSVEHDLIQPRYPFLFSPGMDDPIAEKLSAGLGDCPRQVFNKLIDMIRSAQGAVINSQSVRDMADAYSRVPDSSSGYTPPRGGGGDPCRDHGNIRCP